MNDRLSKTFKKIVQIEHSSSTSPLVKRVRSFKGDSDVRPRSDSIGSIEELVQCPICLERFTQPRMLPCQHTFCLACIQGHVTAYNNALHASGKNSQTNSTEKLILRCPSCNAETTLQKGTENLEQLPPNVYINSLLRFLESSSEPPTPVTLTTGDIRCIKCETICQFEGIKCQHCKQIFCKICWEKHTKELEEKLLTLSSHLDDSETRLNHKVDEADGRCNKLTEAIRQATEEKVLCIRSKEENLLKEVHESKIKEKESSNQLREKITDLKRTIENLNLQHVDEYQKVAVFMNLHRNTSKILDEVSHWGENRKIFDSETLKLDEDNEGLISDVEESPAINGLRLTTDPLESSDTLVSYYRTKSFVPKLQWTKIPRPAGVAVAPWSNNIYIAATDTQMILIINPQKAKVVGKITTPEMLCPHGITFSKNRKEIYVTDKWKHCIHVFSSFGDYLRSLCSKGSSEGKIRSPEGIAISPDDEIVVCDTGNDRIVVLDPLTGKQITSIGWLGLRTLLNMPTSVAVTENRRIVVADSGNHRIKVFNMTGAKLLEIGSLGRNKGQFRSAEVVAVDPLGFILVGDAGNSRIQIFDPSGSLIRVFGGSGNGTGKFKWVSGIAVTPQLDIITTDYKSRSLQIF